MAFSRAYKIGSIFKRLTGLLKSGALKNEDKPLWYEVYQQYPPKYDPCYDRPALASKVRTIFYEEDKIRARIHDLLPKKDYVDLNNNNKISRSKKLIRECESLIKAKGMSIDEAINIVMTSKKDEINEINKSS